MLTSIAVLIAGLIMLSLGGDMLVRGAASLAERTGMSRMLIGLTIISIGTSAPEFAISAYASWLGKTDIALGNIIGSNIFNVLFALGFAAIITNLHIRRKTNMLDVPIMLGISVLAYVMSFTGMINRWHGLTLFAVFIGFNIFLIIYERKHPQEAAEIASETSTVLKKRLSIPMILILLLAGFALLTIGSKVLVKGAVDLARLMHLSELIISLTIVAIGTSLPEAITAIIAAMHDETDMAVGNIIGSNIVNISGVLGLSAILAPHGVPVAAEVLRFDFPVMLAASFACLPIFYTGHMVSRGEGFVLFAYYILFLGYVVLRAIQHPSLALYDDALLYFCAPLTILTACIYSYREHKLRKDKTY